MKQIRTIGNNIRLLLQQNNMTYKDLADQLVFSVSDIVKICDGRLLLTDQDLKEIADYFKVRISYLLEEKPKEYYKGNLFIHYMNAFNEESNEQMILDILDYYCDMKEAALLNQ